MNVFSKTIVLCAALLLVATAFGYYSRWNKLKGEATLSWDVSGYYFYLPAIFIYKDLKQLSFKDKILEQYQPTNSIFMQGFQHSSGNFVMKYPIGMAIQYLPAFLVANVLATTQDGFSAPYQLIVSIWSVMVAILGLILLQKLLLFYFSDRLTASLIFLMVFGSNYLNYGSIDAAMPHNYLFTLYCALILITISFYKIPTLGKSIAIGFLVGLITITRPTEIIAALIPMAWGLNFGSDALKKRFSWLWKQKIFVLAAIFATITVLCIQLIYWKYVSGEWIVYSYQEQGFSFLHPHILNGLWSFRNGWLVYSPIMYAVLIGSAFILFYFIKYAKTNYPNFSIYIFPAFWTILVLYITFSWDIWWYGGGLGQRALVQHYPLMLFPMAFFLEKIKKIKVLQYVVYVFFGVFIYYNFWLTHQAHRGANVDSENMTRAYFWKIVGRWNIPLDTKKLLDTNEHFRGGENDRKNVKIVYQNNFEILKADSICTTENVITGFQSLYIGAKQQYSPAFETALPDISSKWVRVCADIRCTQKEWDTWKMAQMITQFWKNDDKVKERAIRLHRMLNDGETRQIYMDTRTPNQPFDRVDVLFFGGGSDKKLIIDNLKIETFE